MAELSLVFQAVSFLLWLFAFWFLFRIPACRASESRIRYPSVSLIIPARNEEHNIGGLLDSISSQPSGPDEIIVVNDHSTDRTKEISLEKKAEVLDAEELPSGWLGKPWACMQGALKAKGEILMFLDSDTRFCKNGYEKILQTFQRLSSQEKTAMSVSPYHAVEKPYEQLSLMFNIIMTGSLNAFTPLKNAEPSGLFGPSLIVRKDDYFSIGGHASVRDRILENVFIGEKFRDNNISIRCFGGSSSLSFRMYPDGIPALVKGWAKAFASGASKAPIIILLDIIAWISAGFIIAIFLILSAFSHFNPILWLILYLLYTAQLYWMGRRTGSFSLLSALLFPVHLVFFCSVFFLSLYYQLSGRAVKWKSRKIKR